MTADHLAGLTWLNPPPDWSEDGGELRVVTGERTDFWRETHYGFIRDDGHFRYREVAGDFEATLSFNGEYRELYDQAGLMLRIDERHWVKAGIEYVGGVQMLSAVVTRDVSDWSTMPLASPPDWVTIRCLRQGAAVRLEWSDGDGAFKLFRLAYLPASASIKVGPMCCSPQRAGFVARFGALDIAPAGDHPLHD